MYVSTPIEEWGRMGAKFPPPHPPPSSMRVETYMYYYWGHASIVLVIAFITINDFWHVWLATICSIIYVVYERVH